MRRIDTDQTLVQLGELGRYQLWIFLLGNFVWFFISFQMMSIAFVAASPPFGCFEKDYLPSNTTNWTGNCEAADNITECAAHNYTHFLYDTEHFGESIVSEWSLVCSSDYLTQFATSAYFFGFFIGGALVPGLADRWGRRIAILISAVGVIGSGFATAFAPELISFICLRIVAGISAAGLGVTGWVIACEVMVPERRSWGVFVQGVFWTAGYCLTGVLAMFWPDWRALVIVSTIPSLMLVLYYWLMPESLHWYVATDRHSQATDWVDRAKTVNRVQFDVTYEDIDSVDYSGKEAVKRNVFHILKSPALTIHTLLMIYMWFVNTMVYYGMSLYSTSLAGNRHTNYILSGAVELPAYFLLMLGRRKALMIYHTVAGFSLIALVFVPSDASFVPLFTSLWLIGKFSIASSFMGMWLFGAEVFPTTVRSAGVGLCNVAARFGGMLAPFAKTLTVVHPLMPSVTFAVLSLGAAVVVMVLPETAGAQLAQDLPGVDPGPVLSVCCRMRPKPQTAIAQQETLLQKAQ